MKARVPVVSVRLKSFELGSSGWPEKTKLKSGAKPRLYTGAAILVLAVGIGVYVWRSFSSPSYGQVALSTSDSSPTPKIAEYQTLTTTYYSVNYPGRYHQQASDLPPAGTVDQKVLVYRLGGGLGQSKAEIDIKAAPYGGITMDSTYIYYQKHPELYKLSNGLYRGEIVDVAKSLKGPPETAGLWLHGGFLMIVKLTTPDQTQNINSELKDLLSSVQWRE